MCAWTVTSFDTYTRSTIYVANIILHASREGGKPPYAASNVGVAIINWFRGSTINSCNEISEASGMLSIPERITHE